MTPIAATLQERLAAGRLPHSEALQYAAQTVDALRHLHEEGQIHGALTPEAILVGSNGVTLLPPAADAPTPVTPYTAPELLAGGAPDERTDIFSLGALLYEMFSGRRAFTGDSGEEWAQAIEESIPVPIGDTALDRMIFHCLAKQPTERWQRVQQVHMEVKILLVSARRTSAGVAARRFDTAWRSEFRQLEAKLNSRLDHQYDDAVAELRHLAGQLPLLESHLVSRLEQQRAETAGEMRRVAAELPAIESHLVARLEQRCGEATAEVRQLTAGLPQVESRLRANLEQHHLEIARLGEFSGELVQRVDEIESQQAARFEKEGGLTASLRIQVENLESQLTGRIEEQGGSIAAVRQQAEELQSQLTAGFERQESQLQARLGRQDVSISGLQAQVMDQEEATDHVLRMESQFTERLEAHDSAISALRTETSARFDQQDGVFAALEAQAAGFSEAKSQHDLSISAVQAQIVSLEELKSHLTARVEQHEASVSALQQTAAQLPALASRLAELEKAAGKSPEAISALASRIEQQETALAGLRAAEAAIPALSLRLDRQNRDVEILQNAGMEQLSALGVFSETLNALKDSIDNFGAQMAHIRSEEAAARAALAEQIHAVEASVKAHGANIETIQAGMARTDDFLERVVEAVESLQAMVLDTARERVA